MWLIVLWLNHKAPPRVLTEILSFIGKYLLDFFPRSSVHDSVYDYFVNHRSTILSSET